MNHHVIALEVMGPFAMFTRPDTGATPISYPAPTCSAAKGLFEAVIWRPSVYIRPLRAEICKPVRYERYVTNYGGPLRKSSQVTKNTNYQLIATILVDVHYRVYAEVKQKRRSGRTDHARELSVQFEERIGKGQTFYTPCLGWREFVPTYFGPLRRDTAPDETVNVTIPSLLHSMWVHHERRPTFRRDVEIRAGVISYNEESDAE